MSKRGMPSVSRYLSSVLERRVRTHGKRFGLDDLDESVRSIIRRVEPYTLTSVERVAALCVSVDYVIDHGIPGAFVECGLWRGGSLMAVLLRLRQRGISDRDIVGFDTFTGMTEPTREDVDLRGRVAGNRQGGVKSLSDAVKYAIPEPEVFGLLASTGYDPRRIRLVAGPVEDTLPADAPQTIAVLRLDTDWYASTRHELEHLYPRLSVGGVLLIDDYGHFQGARQAVDEYLQGHRILLQRIDYTGRLAIKQEDR
jgi:O-methyltransferase